MIHIDGREVAVSKIDNIVASTDERPDLSQNDIEHLQRLWDEGKASGPAEPSDIERVIAAAKARLPKTRAG